MNRRIILIFVLGLSLIFSLIGTITNRWYENSSSESREGLWITCQKTLSNNSLRNERMICRKQPLIKSQGLAIFGVGLLSIALILSMIYLTRPNDRVLVYLMIIILLGSTLLLLFSYLLYPRNVQLTIFGYSIYLMIISSLMLLITTGFLTFLARTPSYEQTY